MPMDAPELRDPDIWSALSDRERRDALARALGDALEGAPGVKGARVESGPVERPYDYTAVAETDVGDLRTPLWSHARASVFCDPSIHPANRQQLAPAKEVALAAERLRRRLAVPFNLEARGLTLTLEPEPGVERTWTAERSRFRNRTAVSREDVVTASAADMDVRDLLAHFYTGPSLRAVADDGTAFLLAASQDEEGRRVSLCAACGRWSEGAADRCEACGASTEVVVVTRSPRRVG
jgi:hypothetical protein